jgi:hypothetical protein
MWNRLILLVAAIALVASACASSDRDVLATVDGVEITVEQFEVAFSASSIGAGRDLASVRLDSGDAANILTNLVAIAAIRAPMAEFGVEFPILLGSGDANEQRIISDALNVLADQLLGINAPGDEARVIAEQLAAMDPLDRPMCASHILSDDEAQSVEILARLDAGESFEDLASELSTDPGSGALGGSLGCRAASGYVPEFSTALIALEIDEVSEPVASSFGSHVIVRTADTTEVTDSTLLQARNTVVGEWISTTFEVAQVDLDPAVGVWTGTGIQPTSSS